VTSEDQQMTTWSQHREDSQVAVVRA
jgi:hypothetical protein